jgi:ABC-type cobalamin/Fe3+-siderophores transport system ATPase subunit
MQNATIANIKVIGMHGQFNIELRLNPGLNVLYGLNGRGKTTLLHLVANILELDFDRFRFLQFQHIELKMSNGSIIEIFPAESPDTGVKVVLDNNPLAWRDDESELSIAHRGMLRKVLGNRPIYLPAFRSILERVRNENLAPTPSVARQQELDSIRANEARILRAVDNGRRPSSRYYGRLDSSTLTAHKTVQCRQWFGEFVPVIRYPSIIEVTDRLESEFSDAELETAAFERRMFSDFFLGTIQALLSNQEAPSEYEVTQLLNRIGEAVNQEEDSYIEYHGNQITQQLANVVDSLKSQGTNAGAAEKRVLRLYATTLEQRNQERLKSFERIRKFEEAVNKFLDNKTLHINESRFATDRRPRHGIYVESDNHHQYPLTSLSSGERQVLTMLFSASRMSVASGTFLIDEPELSLHIDWQRMILSELRTQSGDRQIIACTHSPEVGADHAECVQVYTPETFDPLGPRLDEEGSSDSILDENT